MITSDRLPGGVAETLRPFPDPPAAEFAEHVDGLRQGVFLIRRCSRCGAPQWPPRVLCGGCGGVDFAPKKLDLAGTIYTFTVVYRAFHPWFAGAVPYGVVVVSTPVGARVLGFADEELVTRLCCGVAVTGRVEDIGGAPAVVWSAQPDAASDGGAR